MDEKSLSFDFAAVALINQSLKDNLLLMKYDHVICGSTLASRFPL